MGVLVLHTVTDLLYNYHTANIERGLSNHLLWDRLKITAATMTRLTSLSSKETFNCCPVLPTRGHFDREIVDASLRGSLGISPKLL